MNMTPVGGGWTSHTIRGDGDYEAQKRAALAHTKGDNQYIHGLQAGVQSGGDVIKDSRSVYGNVNIMPQQLDPSSNFAQKDSPGSMILDDPINQTASQQLQTSATKTPNRDPQEFETRALDERLARMAKGGMNNLNNVQSLYS